MRLILEDGGAKGIVMYRILDGQLAVVRAKAVMFATGGYGRVYNTTRMTMPPQEMVWQ